MCDMRKIKEIADKYKIAVIEDAAQCFGSARAGVMPGQLSNVACFSFHPLKNLNAVGDGGFIATNDHFVAERIKQIRNHGLLDRDTASEFGFVSRLDSIQATILKIRLQQASNIIEKRRSIAKIYDGNLDTLNISIPVVHDDVFHSYHLYVVEVNNREKVQSSLASAGIQTKVHYPKLICDQPAFVNRFPGTVFNLPSTRAQSQRILSLPIHQHMSQNQVDMLLIGLTVLRKLFLDKRVYNNQYSIIHLNGAKICLMDCFWKKIKNYFPSSFFK